jgi:hypothetical protein
MDESPILALDIQDKRRAAGGRATEDQTRAIDRRRNQSVTDLAAENVVPDASRDPDLQTEPSHIDGDVGSAAADRELDSFRCRQSSWRWNRRNRLADGVADDNPGTQTIERPRHS